MTKSAALVGVSKATLSKAIKSGRLSYAEKTVNGYLIDTSELFRVFPPKPSQALDGARLETPDERGETLAVSEGLRLELEALREQLVDMKTDRDAWREQARLLALTDQSAAQATVQPVGFWGRLFRR